MPESIGLPPTVIYNVPNNWEIQGKQFFMKAAGSDYTDQTADGIHCRWSFKEKLFENHLPKGNLAIPTGPYPTSIGFNKANDFVRLFRIEYIQPVPIKISLNTDRPFQVDDPGATWVFRIKVYQIPYGDPTDAVFQYVEFRFMDNAQYATIRNTIDPNNNPLGFVQQYSGILEVEVQNQLMFASKVCFRHNDPASQTPALVKMEAVSAPHTGATSGFQLACRKTCEVPAVEEISPSLIASIEEEEGNLANEYSAFEGFEESMKMAADIEETALESIDLRDQKKTRLAHVVELIEYYSAQPGGSQELEDLMGEKAILEPEIGALDEKIANLEQDATSFRGYDEELEQISLRIATINQTLGIYYQDAGRKCCRVECENIKYLRLESADSHPYYFELETYIDFLARRRSTKTFKGSFALSQTDTQVFSQLENPNKAVIDTWPKYNEGAAVDTDNYKDRWLDPGTNQGLKFAVQEYLNLSTTDLQAESTLTSTSPGDSSSMDISYLTWLNAIGMDFHVARMLGFGEIDHTNVSNGTRYIYFAQYITEVDVDDMVTADTIFHTAVSLPTGKTNYRLPPAPVAEPVTYGLSLTDSYGNPIQITDPDGYLPWDSVRYVNLNKEAYPYEIPLGPFFETNFEFCKCEFSRPVSFGVEYRHKSQSNWEQPEISHDVDYFDHNNIEETVDIPDRPNAFYTHEERNGGKHKYACYGINWFSRVSPLSNEVETDTTTFPKNNTLLPPMNLAAHYIQQESPLIFTTGLEQSNQLQDTRVTFQWNHIHNHAYQIGNKVQFFHRETAPQNIVGEISAVTNLSGSLAQVTLSSFQLTSVNPPQTVVPEILSGTEANYIGALLTANNNQFLITAIPTPGTSPVIIVEKISDIVVNDPTGSGFFVPTQTWILPQVGDQVLIVENISSGASGQWNQLAKEVDIVPFDGTYPGFSGAPYVEQVTESDGSISQYQYGGIFEPGNMVHLGAGIYEFTFSSYNLPQHPDAGVDWYQGVVRSMSGSGEMKAMEVFRIENIGGSGSPFTKLHFYYPDFSLDPLNTGTINVNFHPGYRVYLGFDSPNSFDASTIEPVPGAGIKYSYLTARSVDTLQTNFFSGMQIPAMLMAREIVPPLPPGPPIGPTFATRPDFYGKSTYTFEVDVELVNGGTPRKPFAVVFYRANERAILEALYTQATVETIVDDLAAILNDPFVTQRWQDLVMFQVEPSGPDQDKFLEHNGYRLPNPDNTATDAAFTGSALPGSMLTKVEDAIHGSFVPLTRQPLIYDYIKQGTETSNSKPVFLDDFGNPMDPSDPAFDFAPMVKIIDDTPPQGKLRFTDYTLDGASLNVYFYHAREISNMQEMSSPSPITGPISLVNSMPAEAPEIKKVITQVPEFDGVYPNSSFLHAAVNFEMNEYLESEGIKKFRIYRATAVEKAQSVQTMVLANEVNFGQDIKDDFTYEQFPPYGETLFYRVVALREILNESGQPELVPSKASNLILASLIDTNNPPSPEISFAIGSTTSGPDQFHNVQLSWDKVTHNGKYYLYKMSPEGNWKLIYQETTNAATISYPPAGNFSSPNDATVLLEKEDADGNPIYHRFMVRAENGSGLLSLDENEVIL